MRKPTKLAEHDTLMAALRKEFRKGQIFEARILSEHPVEGLCDKESGDIFVDKTSGTVDTVLHELLHRLYPKWPEKRVAQTAFRLNTAMSDRERRAWYRRFEQVAQKIDRPVKVA